jgi:hypothetical protein
LVVLPEFPTSLKIYYNFNNFISKNDYQYNYLKNIIYD